MTKKNLIRGSAMLALLVSLVVFGLISMRLLPSLAIQVQRQDEESLRHTIARMREAIDTVHVASSTFDPNSVFDSYSVATSAIASLIQFGLLPGHLSDMTIPGYQWGFGSNTWNVIENWASNTSFQIVASDPNDSTKQLPASWSQGTPDTVATVTQKFFPSQQTTEFDDYPGQNKLGNILDSGGASLEITH